MSDQPLRTADAARLLIEELEAVCAEEARIRATAEAARLRRQRLLAALDPCLSDLPKDQADWIRERKMRALHVDRLNQGRAQQSQFAAVLAYLARHAEQEVKVAEIATHLQRNGFPDLKPTYASDTLRRFERHGIVTKIRHGRYEVNENHRDVIQHQLRWLESELRQRKSAERTAVARHFRKAARG